MPGAGPGLSKPESGLGAHQCRTHAQGHGPPFRPHCLCLGPLATPALPTAYSPSTAPRVASTHNRFSEPPKPHFRRHVDALKAWQGGWAERAPSRGPQAGRPWGPRRRRPQARPGQAGEGSRGRWWAGPGTYLGRSCRPPAAGGQRGSGSRSPPRCWSTGPHSPRSRRSTHPRLWRRTLVSGGETPATAHPEPQT